MNDVRLDLASGALRATVHLHKVAAGSSSLPGWTVVSDGLTSLGQRELAFTLIRTSDRAEDFPSSLLNFLETVHHLASEGRVVGEGGCTGLRSALLGPFVGVGYTEPDRSLAVPLPQGCLIGVLLTEGEQEMWMHCFPQRVLSKLGQLHQFFPYPYWSDPTRQSVYGVGDSKTSFVSKIPHVRARGASATLSGEEISLRLRPSDARIVADRVAAGQGLVLMVDRNPTVRAVLVWGPGQDMPTAIHVDGSDGSSIAGWFVVLAPARLPNDDVHLREDGFAAVLSEVSAGRLVTALRAGEPIRLAGVAPSLTLAVELAASLDFLDEPTPNWS